MGRYKKEPNLMHYYFDDNSAVSRILRQIRDSCTSGDYRKISEADIKKAAKEVNLVRASIDKSTYPFIQDLNDFVFGVIPKKRVIMVVEGRFLGEGKTIPSVIGVDLGVNPYELFQKVPSANTIDTYVTDIKTEQFLIAERRKLEDQRFYAYRIEASRFFYFDDSEATRFREDDRIEMVDLLPLITYTRGHVGISEVKVPSFSAYSKHSPTTHVSYRLKASSLPPKLERRLTKSEFEDIRDLRAVRIVAPNYEVAKDLEERLRNTETIGTSTIRHINTEDFYSNRKANDYRSFKVILMASTKGYNPCVTEIQVVDRVQYYGNEINPESPAHHTKHENKKRLSRSACACIDRYIHVIEQMFGRATMIKQI